VVNKTKRAFITERPLFILVLNLVQKMETEPQDSVSIIHSTTVSPSHLLSINGIILFLNTEFPPAFI